MSDEPSSKLGETPRPPAPPDPAAADPKAPVDAPAAAALRRPPPGAGRTGAVKNPWPFLILVAALIGGGWLIVSWMSDTTRLQDCVMSGRKNCAPMDPKLGR